MSTRRRTKPIVRCSNDGCNNLVLGKTRPDCCRWCHAVLCHLCYNDPFARLYSDERVTCVACYAKLLDEEEENDWLM